LLVVQTFILLILRGFKASHPAHKLSIEAPVLALLIATGDDPCFVNPQ